MPCYSIGHITVKDPEAYKEYAAKAPPTIAAHGGRYLVRAGHSTVSEGSFEHDRHVVLEFPTREALEGWYNSPEYQAILPIRLNNSEGQMVFVDGFDG